MNISELRDVLKRAAGLFAAAGAKSQQKDLEDVEKLLADSGDPTVEDFVQRTVDALDRKLLSSQGDEEVLVQLYAVGAKRNEADSLLTELKGFPKERLSAIGARFTGISVTSVATKAKALKAIETKLKERAYQEGKDRMNAGVTPW